MNICDNETSKIYPDLNPTAPQEPQRYCFKKLTEIEAYQLDEIEVRERLAKKDETIQHNHRYRGHTLNYINSDHWRIYYCCIRQWCWPARWHYFKWN